MRVGKSKLGESKWKYIADVNFHEERKRSEKKKESIGPNPTFFWTYSLSPYVYVYLIPLFSYLVKRKLLVFLGKEGQLFCNTFDVKSLRLVPIPLISHACIMYRGRKRILLETMAQVRRFPENSIVVTVGRKSIW